MSSTRAKISATLASVGVLAAGWGVATADGRVLNHSVAAAADATPSAARTTPATTSPSAKGSASARAGSGASSTTSGPVSGAASTVTTYKDGTYTGRTVSHRFGSVAVTVVISGGRISSVSERVVSDGHGRSDQINARAVPTIRAAVLAADSAQVSTVSGATYTTTAYLSSLQSALDQAS